MKTLEHIKLAVFTGLIVGMLFGIIDIIAKISALSFEWFEFYQTLLISSVVLILVYLIISIVIELVRKIIKLNITKKKLSLFYFVSTVLLLLLFYGGIFIKAYLFKYKSYLDPTVLMVAFFFSFIVVLIYIILLTKGKRLVFSIISFVERKNIKKIIKNCIFIVIVFIIISFFMDLYLLNHIPNFTPSNDLEGYPNILLITLDTVRADHLPLYNYHLNTAPNIDRFANDSVVFDNAIAPSSWTLPSHASLFTGKYSSNHNAVITHQYLDDKEVTLAEILRLRGYNTAGFTGGPHCKARYGMGQGFITYKDRHDFLEDERAFRTFSIRVMFYLFFPSINKILGVDGMKTSEQINKDVFKWLDKNKNQPFFMFINYFDAHDPYTLGAEFRKYFTNETRDYEEVEKNMHMGRYGDVSENIIDYMSRLYDTEIFYLDYHFGKLLNKLDELGIKDNTIIIITADHGEEFYEHGGFVHGQTLYEEVIHVPFIIYYPKEFKAQRIEKRIGIINIFSTILDILQIEIPENVNSISLIPLINNEFGYNREYVLSELFGRIEIPEYDETEQKAISYENWKLIEVYPEKETLPSSLFNLRTDPKEQENLYDKGVEKRKVLQGYIADITGDIRYLEKGNISETRISSSKQILDFYDR